MMAGSYHRFAFADAGSTEVGKVLEAQEPSFNIFIEQHSADRMQLDVALRLMPGAYVCRQVMANVVISRETQHIARDNNDDISLLIPLEGAPIHRCFPRRRHGQNEIKIEAAGAAFLKGNDEICKGWTMGSLSQVIDIPRSRVSGHVAHLDAAFRDGVPQSAALNLLAGYASTLTRDIGPMSSETVRQARETLTDLFVLALGPTRDGAEAAKGSAQAARLARIKADIAANVGNPDLSLEWLAKRHTTRPRAIQDLFYAAGEGFTEYVRGCRLDHAHGLLTDPRQASRNIAEIALASGFGDISWFNNAFRKRFGMTPSEARTAATVTRKNGQT